MWKQELHLFKEAIRRQTSYSQEQCWLSAVFGHREDIEELGAEVEQNGIRNFVYRQCRKSERSKSSFMLRHYAPDEPEKLSSIKIAIRGYSVYSFLFIYLFIYFLLELGAFTVSTKTYDRLI